MLKKGDLVPDFVSVNNDLNEVSFYKLKKGLKLIISVPSVDTSICDAEIKKFSEELSQFKNIQILVLSMDLPFAQKRWCIVNKDFKPLMLSDYKKKDFAHKYDAFLKDLGLLKRTVFVIDKDNKIVYLEYCKAQNHPNYDKAFLAIKNLL